MITRKNFQCFHHFNPDKKNIKYIKKIEKETQQLVFFKRSGTASLEEGQFNIIGRVIAAARIQSSQMSEAA